jgi:hypothetical protein
MGLLLREVCMATMDRLEFLIALESAVAKTALHAAGAPSELNFVNAALYGVEKGVIAPYTTMGDCGDHPVVAAVLNLARDRYAKNGNCLRSQIEIEKAWKHYQKEVEESALRPKV